MLELVLMVPHLLQLNQGGAPLLNHYWPCGSRGGPLTSRLDGYGYVSASWDYPLEYTSDGPVG